MKIGIFLENFTDTELAKDPGTIASGLINKGVDVAVFAHSHTEEVAARFPVVLIKKVERGSVLYWQKSEIDILFVYSWLSLRYTKMIRAAKKANIKVILKLDSDGYLLYPLRPNYLKVFGFNQTFISKATHLLRLAQWYILPKIITKLKIKQIELASALIIESPKAKKNLEYSLSYWKKSYLSQKIAFIPNPIITESIDTLNKENIITCIGRWDDARKNANGLYTVFSQIGTNWQINIIGKGSVILTERIKTANRNIQIKGIEKISHMEIFSQLSKTKILFLPSLTEASPLSASEALSCGCSVVGGPLASVEYFVNSGKSGSMAKNFNAQSLYEALNLDIKKWDTQYSPENIKTYWQSELDIKNVSGQILALIQHI